MARRGHGPLSALSQQVLLAAVSLLYGEHALARRRRWHHSSSGSSDSGVLDLWVVVIICLIVYQIVVLSRKAKVSSDLEQSATQDPCWEEKYLEQNATETFFAMQDAWVARDMTAVKEMVTNEFFQRYTAHFKCNLRDGIHNIVEDVEISRVTVLRIEDFKDDSKDSYSACIAGHMRDYTISDVTGNVISNLDKQLSEFADIYYFVRSGDKWLLREIDAKADYLDLAVSRNYREK